MPVTRAALRLWCSRAVRAGVHLVLGGVIAAGYLVLLAGIVQLAGAAPSVPPALTVVIAVIALPIALTPPLLGPGATEREQAERRRALVLAERNRIARELHDGVGHALAVTTMQASVAEAALASGPGGEVDTDAARAALAEIGRVGRQAMADLDRSLAVLREEGSGTPAAPPPTLADLGSLREQAAAVGQQLRLDGDPADLTGLDDLVSREAYQVLAEAVVNARRHGTGPAELRWHRENGTLTLEVSNAVGDPAKAEGDRGGRGLIGMRERAALIDAALDAGPDGDRWLVRLAIGVGR